MNNTLPHDKAFDDAQLPADLVYWIHANVPLIPGWCTPSKAVALARCVWATRPHGETVVELGVFGGRSLLPMAQAAKFRHGSAPDPGTSDHRAGVVLGVDPWNRDASLEGEENAANTQWWGRLHYDDLFKETQKLIDAHGLQDYCKLQRCSSDDPGLLDRCGDNTVCVLHQDSNHNEVVNVREVELWWPKVRPGGYWVFDDLTWSSGGVLTTHRAQELLVERGCVMFYREADWGIFKVPDNK